METEDELPENEASDLTDELVKKYDPERLLKIMSARAGRGDPLEMTVRARYEKRFGVDLGHVRIVTGEFAEEFNRQRDAYAVTVGSTGMILMGNSPDRSMATAAGEALLAHELTHVAQAQRGLHRRGVFDGAMQFTPEHEEEAHGVEHEIEHGAQIADAMGHAAARMMQEAMKKERTEQIKTRALELLGEAARNHYLRNGALRRP